MKLPFTGFLFTLFFLPFSFPPSIMAQPVNSISSHPIAIAIHGGASNIKKMNLSAAQEKAYRDTMELALKAGYTVLQQGGTSVDAVVAAINVMENSVLFNAGKGSVITHDGTIEMDAAIMNGKTLKAGALTGVKTIKNPITAARSIMDSCKFVFLSGKGAEDFASEQGIEMVDTAYFFTQYRMDQLQRALKGDTTPLDHSDTTGMILPADGNRSSNEKFGTVGCVAVDRFGDLAAGTSTGGIVNKQYNRIGDSPLIGSGTYANNKTCAVSCTGRGEEFIRHVVAYDISALMQYRVINLHDAANYVIKDKLVKAGGRGGCIAMDKNGHIEMPFNTDGMFRGYINTKGLLKISIYEE
jgi:beta-aspartyl-peptidase (threonine type)